MNFGLVFSAPCAAPGVAHRAPNMHRGTVFQCRKITYSSPCQFHRTFTVRGSERLSREIRETSTNVADSTFVPALTYEIRARHHGIAHHSHEELHLSALLPHTVRTTSKMVSQCPCDCPAPLGWQIKASPVAQRMTVCCSLVVLAPDVILCRLSHGSGASHPLVVLVRHRLHW